MPARELLVDKDLEIIQHGAAELGPATNRKLAAAMRRATEQSLPGMYRELSKEHPLLYGTDSLERIVAEFPEIFPPKQRRPE